MRKFVLYHLYIKEQIEIKWEQYLSTSTYLLKRDICLRSRSIDVLCKRPVQM